MFKFFNRFKKKDPRKFAVVSTHFEGVGAVYGPFDTKKQAQAWIDKADFPSPEDVFIRTLHSPSVLEKYK